MIELKDAIVRKLIFHRVSDEDDANYLSNDLFDYENEEEELILKRIFLKPFIANLNTYKFKHDIDLELNPLFKLSRSIYEGGNFIEVTKNIHQHLRSVSKHPNINDGDLFIIQYSDVKMDNTFYDALGIYKVENRDNYIEIASRKLNFKKGIGSRKLDKACLILFTKSPYTLLIIDNGSTETDYWKNEFIKADYKKDNINNTNKFLSLTKNFVSQRLPEELEITKVNQAGILNKSIKFFKEKDNFNLNDFTNEVINDSKTIEVFKQYKTNFEHDKDFVFSDNFSISAEAVNKQARSLKSVIKLDSNFHLYIHGDLELIEQGEDIKGKFYKVYYQDES